MAFRGFLAAFFTLAALVAGAVLIMRVQDASLAEVMQIVFSGDAGIVCRVAGWAALAAAAMSVLTGFIAFFVEEEEDAGRRRGFPKGIPLVFGLVALAIFYVLFDCAERVKANRAPAEGPATVDLPAAPGAAGEAAARAAREGTNGDPAGEAAVITDTPVTRAPVPAEEALTFRPAPYAASDSWAYTWPYMIPLMDGDGGALGASALSRARADFLPPAQADAIADAFCGAAWIAVTGSSSEEGPEARNKARAAVRARAGVDATRTFIDSYTDECGSPHIFGVDLGQHAPTGAAEGDGAATGWQRRAVFIVAPAGGDAAALTAAGARAELEAFIAAGGLAAALPPGADFPAAPRILP